MKCIAVPIHCILSNW